MCKVCSMLAHWPSHPQCVHSQTPLSSVEQVPGQTHTPPHDGWTLTPDSCSVQTQELLGLWVKNIKYTFLAISLKLYKEYANNVMDTLIMQVEKEAS